jgi:hypothetical protein
LLQILPSPWNNARSIFVISGATEEGQASAIRALFDPVFSSDLFGNIVFTTDTDVTAVDTRFVFTPIEILDAIPELAGIAQLVPQPATATPDVAVLVITATPQPTQLTTTPVIVTATPEATLIFTPTPVDAFTTPLPAVQPLTQEAIQQSIQVERPQWVSILIGISVVLVAVALLYNMVVTIWNRGKKDE